MSLAIQAGTHGSDVPPPPGDTRGALQWEHSCQNAGGNPLGFEILKLGTGVRTQPESQRTDAPPSACLAAAAIELRAIQVQPAERCSVVDPVGAVSAKPRLALRTGRVLNDGFASLGLDHEALYRAGHRFRFLEAQTDQIVGPPFDRSDVGRSEE